MDASKQILKPSQVFFHKIYDFNEHIVEITQLSTLPNFNKNINFVNQLVLTNSVNLKSGKC